MGPISVLIKPASGNCNLRCDYCFYYDAMAKRAHASYGYMSLDTLEAVIRGALASAQKCCAFAFQGGEPTLCGLPFFEKAVELEQKYNVNGVRIENALQTNGYAIDEAWADFFVKNNFLVGVSLDGGPRQHDCYRKTPDGRGSFSRIMENVGLLQKKRVEFNILSVVNAQTAPQIARNYRFYRKNGLDYLQFIACLDPLGEKPGGRPYSLRPEVYGKFLIELFDLWYEELKEGKQPYIRQFENYIAILLGQMPESCDMRGVCGKQYVVEADGSVYPCDFYVLDDFRLGSFLDNTVEELDEARARIGFVEASRQREKTCAACPYLEICRGGCRRTRLFDEGYHQYFCESYRMFFDARLGKLREIAARIR